MLTPSPFHRRDRLTRACAPALCLAATAALVAGCLDGAPPGAEVLRWPITDGVSDTGHPNVGLLLIDAQGGVAQSICTGTLVGKKTVLVAAHCCKQGVNILFQLGTVHQVTKVIPHPSWTSLYKHDIGLAILQNPLTVAPAEAGTVTPTTGMKITLVGYGRTSTSVSDSGKKRKATNTISGVGSGYFTVSGTGGGKGNTCTGDSGGPVLATVGGKEKVVGVISSSEATCGVKSWHVTVKDYLAWLKTNSGGDIYQPPPPKLDGAAPAVDGAAPAPDHGADEEGGTADLVAPASDMTYDTQEPGPRGSDGCAVGAGQGEGATAPPLLLALLLLAALAARRRR